MGCCGAVPAERWKALEAQAVPALLRLLADGTARVELRQRAIVELAELRAPSALAAVSTVLLDPSEATITRAHAARAIGVIGDAAGIPALGRATTQGDPVVRRQVALALDRFDTPQALRGLLRLVSDADGEVARVAQSAVERQSKHLTTALKSILKPRQAPPTRQRRGKTAPRPESKVTGRR
jgi:HEAT repeat protein